MIAHNKRALPSVTRSSSTLVPLPSAAVSVTTLVAEPAARLKTIDSNCAFSFVVKLRIILLLQPLHYFHLYREAELWAVLQNSRPFTAPSGWIVNTPLVAAPSASTIVSGYSATPLTTIDWMVISSPRFPSSNSVSGFSQILF
jgi:hypothetical protein